MDEAVPLRIATAFGPSRDKTLLLAMHPDEAFERGKARPDRRTLVLSLKGTKATFQEERPMALVRSWYSTGSGVAYCTGITTNTLYKWQAGKWSDENFSASPAKSVRFIFGLPGATPEDDQLFLASADGLFIRTKGTWTQHSLGGDKTPYQIHGRSPAEVFIGGETLHKWNGATVEEIDGPDDGDIIDALWVTSDDRLVGGDSEMSITEADGSWSPLAVPAVNYGNLEEFRGIIFASSGDGVAQVLPPLPDLVSPPAALARIVNVGDALIAIGNDVALVGDGTTWSAIQVPSCEVGKRPR